MKFEEALVELKKWKSIRRKLWINGERIGFMKKSGNFNVSYEELHADDWEVLEEPGKTFPEVFEDFKEGKKIKRKHWISCDYLSKDSNICGTSVEDLLSTDWEVI